MDRLKEKLIFNEGTLHFILIMSFILAEYVRIFRRIQLVILHPEWYPYIGMLEKLALLTAVIIIILNSFQNKYSVKMLNFIVIISAVVILVAHFSYDLNPLKYWVFIVAAVDIELEELVKYSAIAHIVLIFPIVILSELGLIVTCNIEAGARGFREYLGFNYANTVPNYFFYITMMIIYWKKESISWIELIIIELVACYLFYRTDSKNAFILISISILAIALFKGCKKLQEYKKIYGISSILAVTIMPVVAVLLSIFYNGNIAWMAKLNSFTTGRLGLGNMAFNTYGLTLFGQPITWVGMGYPTTDWANYNYVDCSFLQILLNHGVIFSLLVILVIIGICIASIESKNVYFLLIITMIVIHSLFDSLLIDMDFNPFFVIIGFFILCIQKMKSSEEQRVVI